MENTKGGAYQDTLFLHQHAESPSRMAIGLGLVDNDGIEQALTAHRFDDRTLNGLQTLTEDVTQLLRPFDHLFIADNLQSTDGHGTAQRVPAIGRTMRAGLNGQHDVLATQNTGHRIHSTGDGLAQQHQIRLDSTPFVAEKLPRPGNTGLDLIADQQGIVLIAQGSGLLQVILVRNNNSCLALDGFDQEGSQVGACFLERFAQSGLVVVRDRLISSGDGAANVGEIGAIVLARFRIGRKRNGRKLERYK